MACSPPGWMEIHFVTSMASPFTTIQASSWSGSNSPVFISVVDQTSKKTWMKNNILFVLYQIHNKPSVTTHPKKKKRNSIPTKKSKTKNSGLSHSPSKICQLLSTGLTHRSARSFLLCLATSSRVTPGGPASATGAAAGRVSNSWGSWGC